MKRTLFSVVWATLFGLLAAACGSGVGAGGAAIEFGGQTLPRSEVSDFAGVFGTLGAEAGAVAPEANPTLIAQSLEFFAASAAIEDAMSGEITAEDRDGGKMWAESTFPQVAEDTVLFERLSGYWASRLAISETEMRARLEIINADQGEQVCASHILVADEAQALDLISQVEGGADFAGLAAEFSTDTGSGAQGGSLGCVPEGQYVPEFEAAVWQGAEGDLLGPIETQFGFHVILHEGFTEGGFEYEDVQADLRDAVFNDRIGQSLIGANVQLDPRYGTWNSDEGTIALPEGAEVEGEGDDGADLDLPIGE